MKKYELVLKNNEELIIDCDDLMEQELVKFQEAVKDIEETDLTLFDNWVNVYKLLNYDIIENLTVDKVYKFNSNCAVIELTFRNVKEYDFLSFNSEDMTVSCMNVKDDAVRNYIVRRLLVPQTTEDALSFAKINMVEEAMRKLQITINELKSKGAHYEVKLNDSLVKVEVKEEPVTEEVKEEEKVEEPKAEEVKEETTTEEPKAEEVKEEEKVEEPKAEEVKEETTTEEVKEEEKVEENNEEESEEETEKDSFVSGFFNMRKELKKLRKENKNLKKELREIGLDNMKKELHNRAAIASEKMMQVE
jgi:hypothetical protein